MSTPNLADKKTAKKKPSTSRSSKGSAKNIAAFFTSKNLIQGAKIFGVAALVEAVPALIQMAGGKDETSQAPKLNMTGAVPDLAIGGAAILGFAAFKKYDYAAAIALVKSMKRAYIHLNPPVLQATGTPAFLPSQSKQVIVDKSMSALSDDNDFEWREFEVPGEGVQRIRVRKSLGIGDGEDVFDAVLKDEMQAERLELPAASNELLFSETTVGENGLHLADEVFEGLQDDIFAGLEDELFEGLNDQMNYDNLMKRIS